MKIGDIVIISEGPHKNTVGKIVAIKSKWFNTLLGIEVIDLFKMKYYVVGSKQVIKLPESEDK